MTLVACAAPSCVQIMYLFYSVALLHKYFTSLFIYSHICCLIHTCIFYLYISVDYLQGRSASTPGEIPVTPFFFETSDVCVHFCAFSAPPLSQGGLACARLGYEVCNMYGSESISLLNLRQHHFCHCSRFI